MLSLRIDSGLTSAVLVAIAISYAKDDTPRAALATVKHGQLVYLAQVLLATFSLISIPEKWFLLACSTNDRAHPSPIIKRGSKSFLVWLLIDLIVGAMFLTSFIMQCVSLPFSYRSHPQSSAIVMTFVENQPQPKPGEKPNKAAYYCNSLLDFEGMTLGAVIMSMHVTSVGMLLVVWRPQPWLPSTPSRRFRTDDWASGRTGMSKLTLKGLQMLLAPIRFCYRCFCRWSWPIIYHSLAAITYCIGATGAAFMLGFVYSLAGIFKLFSRSNDRATKSRSPITELHSVYTGAGPGTSILERMMTMDDLFYQLASHLHANELIRLALVSRTCRGAVKEQWPSQACQKALCFGSAERCFSCEMPVCTTGPYCGWATTAKLSESARQQNELQAICSACYFLNLCMPRETFQLIDRKCTGSKIYHTSTQWRFRMPLCDLCRRKYEYNGNAGQVYKLKNARAYRQGKLSVMRYDPAKCCSCGAGLWALTLRWWRCSTCNLECRKDLKVYGINERWRQVKNTFRRRFTLRLGS